MAERDCQRRTILQEGREIRHCNPQGASNSDNYGKGCKLSHRQGPNLLPRPKQITADEFTPLAKINQTLKERDCLVPG